MKSIFFALLMVFGMAAQAQDMGVVFGIRNDGADAENSGVTVTGKNSFNVGGVAKFELSGPWHIRSGFIYTQRFFEVKSGTPSTTNDMKFTYFEVPVGAMYKFSDYGGAFIGPAFAFNISKDCGSATCEGVNSMPMFLQFGGSFKFAPQMGAEIYYETGFSKLADGLKSPRGVVANFMITFD